LISYANFHLEKIDFDTIIATFVAIIISIINLLAKSMRLKPPKFLRRLMPDLIWDIEDERNVFLTFDDGPTPGITEWILTTLDKYDAKATFFCLGKNVEAYPDLYQRIIDAGHRVGNHSYSHQKGWSMPTDRYVEDVDFAADFIQSDLFRPPYARITPAQTRALAQRYRLIMWDIISRDYNRQISPETCLRNVLPYLEGGSIVVFHDSVKAFRNMRYALPRTLEEIRRRGLKCARIE
jgi:peptidoglycan/xylan/chitin deacetylase (PgdA/CDA1 family)